MKSGPLNHMDTLGWLDPQGHLMACGPTMAHARVARLATAMADSKERTKNIPRCTRNIRQHDPLLRQKTSRYFFKGWKEIKWQSISGQVLSKSTWACGCLGHTGKNNGFYKLYRENNKDPLWGQNILPHPRPLKWHQETTVTPMMCKWIIALPTKTKTVKPTEEHVREESYNLGQKEMKENTCKLCIRQELITRVYKKITV